MSGVCGGFLISKWYAVTAEHCGSRFIQTYDDKIIQTQLQYVNEDNDIAILRLSKPVSLQRYAKLGYHLIYIPALLFGNCTVEDYNIGRDVLWSDTKLTWRKELRQYLYVTEFKVQDGVSCPGDSGGFIYQFGYITHMVSRVNVPYDDYVYTIGFDRLNETIYKFKVQIQP